MKDGIFEHENVASATECTGLMAALPGNKAEDENLAELCSIHAGTGKDQKCGKRTPKRR